MDVIPRLFLYLLILGLTYGSAISLAPSDSSVWIENLAAFAFVTVSCFIYFKVYKKAYQALITTRALVAVGMAAPVGIFLACALFGSTERNFWVSDAVLTHAPSAEFLLSVLRQEVPFRFDGERSSILKPEQSRTAGSSVVPSFWHWSRC